MKLSNKTYDVLKIIAIIILPLGELVASLVSIWGIPYGVEIVASLSAINLFLGALLKTSSDNYGKVETGEISEGEDEEPHEVDDSEGDPEDLSE